MPPRTYTCATKTKSATTTAAAARRSRTLQAKCLENQTLVDQLAEKREQIAPGNNFTFTLKKAMDSIIACPQVISSYEEAVALKNIGPSIGKMLFPLPKATGQQPKVAAPAAKPTKKGRGKKKALEDSSNAGASSSPSSSQEESEAGSPLAASATAAAAASSAAAPSTAAANLKRRPDKQEIASMALKSVHQQAVMTKKEKSHVQAVHEAESYKGKNLLWQLVLLIDKREKQCEHYSSKVAQCGVPTEIRTLPIGDMAWIAQGRTRSKNNSNNNGNGSCGTGGSGGEVVAELMLGTIVERKEVADLVSSLFGTRYNEQQLRLKASGLPQVIFLIEGNTKSDQRRFTADAINSVLWAIRIEKQNQVVQTEHMEETVNTLRLMHRRILKRTFPTAFYAEALPAFSEPGATSGRPQRQRDSFGEPHQRRRRRRLESLHGLVFDQEPIPMAGMPRFITYQELCAKVERDREMGTRTIGSIHQAMLKQVETIGNKKIIAINREYRTPHSLLQAYDQMPNGSSIAARKAFLANLRLDEEDDADNPDVVAAGTKAKVLGEKSAGELAIAYSVDESLERRNSVDGIHVNGEHQTNHVNHHAAQARKPAPAAATTATTTAAMASAATTSRAAATVATGAAKAIVNPSIATAGAAKRSVLAAAAASRASAAPTISSAAAATNGQPDNLVDQEAADLERAIAASLVETTRKHAAAAPTLRTTATAAAKANQQKNKLSQQEENRRPLSREELVELLSSSSSSSEDEAKIPAAKPAATKKRPMSLEFSDDSLLSPSPPPPKKRLSTGNSNSSNNNSSRRNDEGNLGPGLDWSSSIDGTTTKTAPPLRHTHQAEKPSRPLASRLLDSSSSSDDDDHDEEFAALMSGTQRTGGPTETSKKSSGAAKMKPQQEIIEIDD